MSSSARFKLAFVVVLALLAADAWADRRTIRVDGFDQFGNPQGWQTYLSGSSDCPGTTAGSAAADTLVHTLNSTFSGLQSTAYLIDDYCQVAQSGTMTTANFLYDDESSLTYLFGKDPNAITGTRYSFLDQDRFSGNPAVNPGGTPPSGFQWGFYTFPSAVTVVGLYGLAGTTLNSSSYINTLSFIMWSGQYGYDGQYFCFRDGGYIGTWNGELTDSSSACLKAIIDRRFSSGFEPGIDRQGVGSFYPNLQSDKFVIGTNDCPGTTIGSTLVQRMGYIFSGGNSTHLVDDYCEVVHPDKLTFAQFYYDEVSLAYLFGNNPGHAITSIRYSFLDYQYPYASAFQWGFYTFPNGVTLVSLYGFENNNVALNSSTYIRGPGSQLIWSGENGYDGQYFCFRNNAYIGSWNGNLSETSACLTSLLGWTNGN
jgi:hypothetical protein